MKTDKITRKLELNKETVTTLNLEDFDMKEIKGGNDWSIYDATGCCPQKA
jgi:hypothetical protein